ncbi:rab-GTPase-TBC domain-containing protein [Pelagophyceae sp. CCMP2097]|nr:rab-GTPase-TBC domain-containing protein [Pelagophyceae sp. CCMP2097]
MPFTLTIAEPGPLYVRLKYDAATGQVNNYDSTPHGGPGPVEACASVRVGDALLSVGGVPLKGVIKQSAHPRILVFERASTSDEPPRRDAPDVLGQLRSTALKLGGIKAPREAPVSAAFDRAAILRALDSSDVIDEATLRAFSSAGLPRSGGTRPLVWRLLLRYLPLVRCEWCGHVDAQRALYSQFLSEFQMDEEQSEGGSGTMWAQQQLDSQLIGEIRKDVIRTLPNLQFFTEAEGPLRHAAMERILFVYAKLNPGVRYVQGMNEVLGTIFFCFASDESDWKAHAEARACGAQGSSTRERADAFFCFTALMAEMRDVYMHSLDNSDSGIHGKIGRLDAMLQARRLRRLVAHDPQLHAHLRAHRLDPGFYALRWITTLLAREFDIGDTMRLWDAILANTARVDFLLHFSLTMLLAQRTALLESDFAECLQLLQRYPASDPEMLLRRCRALQAAPATKEGGVAGALATFANLQKAVQQAGVEGVSALQTTWFK